MSSNITFGATTWLWTSPFNTSMAEPIFQKMAGLGFNAVEIAVEDPAVIDAAAVGEALRKYNLQPIVCGAFTPSRDLTHEDPAVHEQCFSYIEKCLQFAKAWDSKMVVGPMYSAVGKARMLPPEKRRAEWNLAVKNLRRASEMAAQFGCVLALEPLNRFESDLVNTAEDICRLIRDIAHPAAKIMLDNFHMCIEETDPGGAIRRAGKDLAHMQISENHRGIPGTGTTPWPEYAKALKDIGYSGVVSIESFTPSNQDLAEAVCIWRSFASNQDEFASQGLNFMRSLFKENNIK